MTWDEIANTLQIIGGVVLGLSFIVGVAIIWAGIKANSAKDANVRAQGERIEMLKAQTAKADEGIATANVEITKAQAETAKANKEIEKLRIELVEKQRQIIELQDRVKPRTLTREQRNAFIQRLTLLPGETIELGYSGNDNTDGFDFAMQFLPLFAEAGWIISNKESLTNHIALKVIGVGILVVPDSLTKSIPFTTACLSLQNAFRTIGIQVEFIDRTQYDKGTLPHIVIGSKRPI